MDSFSATIWTIGHSRHELEDLFNLIQKFQIEVIVDVRTIPMSKMTPQFNEGVLNKFLNSMTDPPLNQADQLCETPKRIALEY